MRKKELICGDNTTQTGLTRTPAGYIPVLNSSSPAMDGPVGAAPDAGPPAYCRGNENSLVSALKTLLFFTILMVTLPIGLYFATKAYVFEGSMKMSSSDSYFYAAIVAVLAVHVVLALFVYVAWNEGTTPQGKGKDD
ncbi:vacuolar ATPase assembly integral membrane protein vma21 [Pseudoliparis swirei]|uniref:vacuolar ATPase assembly integral membrane protein vma21 n=1 Tax=Pseudoliparis swirei TaxID=2059687 RepID=UPI0024BE9A77|nr:vacuolar ATPase assembly integral membrane protein vma21 [Pseudoliparis swirei]